MCIRDSGALDGNSSQPLHNRDSFGLENALAVLQLVGGRDHELVACGNAAGDRLSLAQRFTHMDNPFLEPSVHFNEGHELAVSFEERPTQNDRHFSCASLELYCGKHPRPEIDVRGIDNSFDYDVTGRGSHLGADVLDGSLELPVRVSGNTESNLGAGASSGNLRLGKRELEAH